MCYLVAAPICGKLTDVLGSTGRRIIFLSGLLTAAFGMLMLGPSPAFEFLGHGPGWVYLSMGILGASNAVRPCTPLNPGHGRFVLSP